MQQAINWTSVDQYLQCHMASLGHIELSKNPEERFQFYDLFFDPHFCSRILLSKERGEPEQALKLSQTLLKECQSSDEDQQHEELPELACR